MIAMKRTAFKHIGAVLAGFIVTLVLTRGMDILLESIGVFPTVEEQQKYGFNILWMNVVAILYRIIFTILGGYLVAKLSPSKLMRNVNILGVVGVIVAVIGNIIVSQIPKMANVLPVWFSIALVLIAFPSVWLGGKLALKKKGSFRYEM
jgi:hypothetical protein